MKKIKRFLLVFIALFTFTIVSCNNKVDNKSDDKSFDNLPIEYTITFDSKGGSDVAPIKANAGVQIQAPSNPTKEGFTFINWFLSIDNGTTLDDNAFIINYMPAKNITLYAKWEQISEVNKKYFVKDYKTDVNFKFADPSTVIEDLDLYKMMYSTMYVIFKENNAVEIFLHAELEKDTTHFYAINSKNCVEFFESEDDAKNMTNKITYDYFGFDYQFDSNKEHLTVTMLFEEESITATLILSAINL